VGTPGDSALEAALLGLVGAQEPELIVASGDLTHRGRKDQHARAAALLRSLGPPVLAVPGNHDIPYSFPGRFTRTFDLFERYWEITEPMYRSAGLFVLGLNSVRTWRQQSGRVRPDQLRRVAAAMHDAPVGALRVVVLHHHLIGAPWRSRKKPVSRRSTVLAALVEARAELVLAGHVHQSAISERREFELTGGGEQAIIVSTAPGLGQPRPRRRGEARGLHIYDVVEEAVTAMTYTWLDREWALTAMRRFPRGVRPLASVEM
jgi:3',5'-cyclic AMP phosphodiesterase CpdA